MRQIDERTVLADILRLLSEITQDWDVDFSGGLSPQTKLVAELGFESIDMVMFIEEIQRYFDRSDLPFEEFLIVDGNYVDDVEVSALARFVHRHVNGR